MGAPPEDQSSQQLARDHSYVLAERLKGWFSQGADQGPTSFAGLLPAHALDTVNEYGSLASVDEDEDGGTAPRPLSRLVSSLARVLPDGVQLATRVDLPLSSPPLAAAAAAEPQQLQQQQQQPPEQPQRPDHRLSGWLDLDAGRKATAASPARRAPSPSPPPPVVQAQASPVPGKPLKIRLKIARAGSEQRGSPPDGGPAAPDPHTVLRAVRQLGADRPLSPIPASWAEALRCSPAEADVVMQPAAAVRDAAAATATRSPGVKAEAVQGPGAGPGAADQQQAAARQGHAQPQQAAAAPEPPTHASAAPAARVAAGSTEPRAAKRPCPGPEAVPAAAAKQAEPETDRRGSTPTPSTVAAAESTPTPKRPRATPPPQPPSQAKAAATPAQQAPAAAGRPGGGGGLAAVAAALPGALSSAAAAALGPGTSLHELQKEGKQLKKFSEKKVKDGKPTHISSMFLCQSCVKFLEVAATMEAHPAKYSRENTASMYSQTASLLDSCAANAARAEGPAPSTKAITKAITLLAQRLAGVARLRAAHCLRAEGAALASALRAAFEKGSGETFQRPSPTDSNTSASISVPLEGGGAKAAASHRSASVPLPGAALARAGAEGGSGGTAAAAALPLVAMPKALLERQLVAAQHSGAVLGALSSFARSGQQLREYLAEAAAQGSEAGLKAATAALLLSADAGMGPAGAILALAKEALDAIMALQ